jgi:prepilin-type N-terminal cleavage/methylation domain-containing protein
MKSSSSFRSSYRSGFTLVELLVVICIIAILAAVLLEVGSGVINSAKRAKAMNTATQIQTAALNYYTEYSVYPVPTATTTDIIYTDANSDGGNWATLMCVLCGNIHPSTGVAITAPTAGPLNNRGIAFLSLRSSDVCTSTDVSANSNYVVDAPKNPLPTSTGSTITGAFFFNIAFDTDYNNVIGDSTSAVSGKLPNFSLSTTTTMNMTGTSTAGVAVWGNCNGKSTSTNPNLWVHTY